MTTVVGIALWLTLAAAFWWLARRNGLLLNHAEALLANAAKDRHPAGSRIEADGDAPNAVAEFVPVAETDDPNYVRVGQYLVPRDPLIFPEDEPQPGPATQPAAAVIDDGWEQERDAAYAAMLAEIRGVK